MGIEFIRAAGGKPYVKRWAKNLNRLKMPTLVDVRLREEGRVVTATLVAGDAPKPGLTVLVQITSCGDLVVVDGLKQIACVANPPPDVTAALVAQLGMATAVVQRIGGFGRTAEIRFK